MNASPMRGRASSAVLQSSLAKTAPRPLQSRPRGLQLFRPGRVMGVNEPTPVQTSSTEPSRSIAFTKFMRAYQDMVFTTAARLAGNDAQAQDISQEVFIKAFEHFDHLQASQTAGGWLKTVATNLSLNYLTGYRKPWRLFSEESEVPEPPVPDSASGEVGAEQQHAAIEEALR